MKTQLQKAMDDLYTEKTNRETIAADNKKLKQQVTTSNSDYTTEKQFRNQLVKEINTLRKQAIERDTQFSQLLDKFIAEKREKEQLLAYLDESNWKVCS